METKRYTEADGYCIEARPEMKDGFLSYELQLSCGPKRVPRSFAFGEPNKIPPALLRSAPKGISNASHFFCGTVIRNSARPWIEALWRERQESIDAAMKAEHAAFDAIPGYRELVAAIADKDRYRREFDRMMEDESNDGANPPRHPQADASELARRFPEAAALVRAESYEHASHWAKAKAGGEARELLLRGGKADEANRILENWLEDNHVEVD